MAKAATAKPKHTKKSFLRLFKLLKPMWKSLALIFTFVVLSSVCQILAPVFFADLTSEETMLILFQTDALGIITVNLKEMILRFAFIAGLYVAYSIFGFLGEYMVSKVGGVLTYRMRRDIKDKLDKLPLEFFDRNTNGDILSRVSNDIDTISTSMQQILTQVIKAVCLLIGTTIAMFIVSWQCALIAFATLPLSIVIALVIGKHSQPRFVQQQALLGEVNARIEESYAGFKVIKLFNKEGDINRDFVKVSNRLAAAGFSAFFFSGMMMPFMTFVSNVGYVGICVVAGLLSSTGFIVSFFMFLNIFQQPIQQVAQLSSTIQQTAAASERVFAILDGENQVSDGPDAVVATSSIEGRVDFEHVDFSYRPDQPLIEDLNLHVEPGDSIAIVGPTGAGKTTLVNLIMRFYEVTGGRILIDGTDITDYTRSSLRTQIGMVLQDTWLFNGTIAENIAYGNIEATREQIVEAAKEARAHHFIMTLPDGYDTILNEEGTNVSQGQRQLITIARAILSNPRILILDEATSSVDTRTEKALQDAMTSMMKNRTTFVIAHRLSTIKSSKMILVMNKGHIVERGSHKELLEKGGFYADLYNAQFMGNKDNVDETQSNS